MAAHGSAPEPTTDGAWWGPVPVPDDRPRRLQIGPLRLGLTRGSGELGVRTGWGADPFERTVRLDVDPGDAGFFPDDATVTRYALAQDHKDVDLSPLLADIPVVSRPEHPFTLLPGESATIFVGTPLFVRLEIDSKLIAELPLGRLRRTWFGTSEEGELAYASRTFCRLSVDELTLFPHRATTAVTLTNDAPSPLDLTRLLIPAPNLSLGVDEAGRLWTDDIHLIRAAGDPYAPFTLESGSWRRRRPDVRTLAEPRVPLGGTNLLRLLAPIF